MDNLFEGGFGTYRTITSETYRSVLENGLVILDTNTLLDLYRYNEKTRKDFLGLYASIGHCLWIPHHVMFEFFERRIEVMEERIAYLEITISDLDSIKRKYVERLTAWANRINLPKADSDKAIALIDSTSGHIEREIHKFSRDDSLEGAEDTSRDPVLIALNSIVGGRIGKALSQDELKKAKAEARKRIEDCRPPGFMDANKKGDNAEGDYIIWYEVLQEAKRRQADVLIVTRDQKKDWWRIEKGQAKGPRWELVAELENLTGRRLFMLRPASLADHAREPLPKESVQDAKRVSSKAHIGWRGRPGWGTVRNYTESVLSNGRLDISFLFIPDDGSEPTPINVNVSDPVPDLGEYARGIFTDGENFNIRVKPDTMKKAESSFERINKMNSDKRKQLFLDTSDIHEDCGWAWTPDYTLIKSAPGLMD